MERAAAASDGFPYSFTVVFTPRGQKMKTMPFLRAPTDAHSRTPLMRFSLEKKKVELKKLEAPDVWD